MDTKNYWSLMKEIEEKEVTLVAVSKYRNVEDIRALYEEGQRHFGENRVQALLERKEDLPADIHWHMIGHLQRNKVKDIVSFIHLIQSVDSFRLLKEIQKEALKINRKISVLLQFKIAKEDSKYGFNYKEFQDFHPSDYSHIRFEGVMGMATFTDRTEQVREEFKKLYSIFQNLKQDKFSNTADFKEISMGMSGDFRIALSCGSTMLRVGSLLFK